MLKHTAFKKLSLALFAATCLMPLAAAQEHELNLSFEPSTGIQGVYAFIEADTQIQLRVDAIKQDALAFVAIQAANSKGDIDLRTAMHLVPLTKWYAGNDLVLRFSMPADLADRVFSVQAVARTGYKTFLTSPVVSLLVAGEQGFEKDPIDPDIAGEGSGSREQAASGPRDAEKKAETKSENGDDRSKEQLKKDAAAGDEQAEQGQTKSKDTGPIDREEKHEPRKADEYDRYQADKQMKKDALEKERRAAAKQDSDR